MKVDNNANETERKMQNGKALRFIKIFFFARCGGQGKCETKTLNVALSDQN